MEWHQMQGRYYLEAMERSPGYQGRQIRSNMKSQKLTCKSLRDLFIDDNINTNSSSRCCLQHPIQTVFFIELWWTAQIQLGTQPP
jgi:hypothetical protein